MKKSEVTRQTILQKAFELIYVNGYQATSIDHIIATTQVTKGAFFYHFKTKEEMGLAVISEVMYGAMSSGMVEPLLASEDPLTDIYAMMEALLLTNPYMQLKYGCPTYNLIQEMAPLNASFSKELSRIMELSRGTISHAIAQGKAMGQVRKDVDGLKVANFIMAGYGGVRILGKLEHTNACYHAYLEELKGYLHSLRN